MFDKELEQKIVIVAAGGTTLTLLGAKPSTQDIDFTIPSEYVPLFDKAEKAIPHGYRIDRFKDGVVFTQILPQHYLKKSIRITAQLENIELRALQPLDIVASKVGRLDERDKEDIKACIGKFKLSKKMVERRTKQVQYAGNEDLFNNLDYVLNNLFE